MLSEKILRRLVVVTSAAKLIVGLPAIAKAASKPTKAMQFFSMTFLQLLGLEHLHAPCSGPK